MDQKSTHFIISIQQLVFGDNHIYVNISGKFHKITCFRSNKSYNYVKEHIRENFKIVISDKGNEDYEITNAYTLEYIFDRLEIEQALDNSDINNSNYFVRTFLSRWSNVQLIRSYNTESRTPYLKHLCKEYSDSFRIIPVKEKRQSESKNNTIAEDAFLFPIRSNNWLYILWESVEESRATYIFRCKPANYSRAVQKVFDYIASPDITNKRDRLRQGEVGYFKGEIVEYYKSLNHDELGDWKRRLKEICC